MRWVEEVAAAARELPWEQQSDRMRAALGGLVQFMPPPAALHGRDELLLVGRGSGLELLSGESSASRR